MPGQIFPTSTRWDTPPAGATALCWTPPWRWPPSPPCSPCLAQSSRWWWWRWWWQVRLWWWRWWWQLWLWGWQWRSSHVCRAPHWVYIPKLEYEVAHGEYIIMSISRLCLEGRKDQPWFSMDLPPSHNLRGDTTIATNITSSPAPISPPPTSLPQSRQGTSPQYQDRYLDLAVWYWHYLSAQPIT